MTPQIQQQTKQTETVCVSRMIPILLGTILLMGGYAPIVLATPADCQYIDLVRENAIRDGSNSQDTSLQTLAPILTPQRNLYGPLGLAPVLKAAPHLRSSRFGRGDMENRDIKRLDTCWTQSFPKNTVVKQAVITATGRGASKGFMQVRRIPTFPYNGMRQVFQARAILPDSATIPRQAFPSIIGPVQENVTVDQSNIPSLHAAVAMGPSSNESLSPFGSRAILATDALKTSFRLPGNESLRMNMTTTQALHGGNCANGCQ